MNLPSIKVHICGASSNGGATCRTMATTEEGAVPHVVLEATSPSEEADATATTSSANGTKESSGDEPALGEEGVENFINGPIQLPYVFTAKGIPGRKRFRPYTPPTAAKVAAVTPVDGDNEAPPATSEDNDGMPRTSRPSMRGGLRRPLAPSPELAHLLATKRTLLARHNQLEDDVRRLKLAARCADPVRRWVVQSPRSHVCKHNS